MCDARRRRVDAQQQRREVEPVRARDHDLAVEHRARRQRRAQRRLQLGEVAAQRLRDRGSAGRSRRRRGTPACGSRPTSARTASRRPRGCRASAWRASARRADRRAASKQTSHRAERRADQREPVPSKTGRAPGVPKRQRPSASRASIAGIDGAFGDPDVLRVQMARRPRGDADAGQHAAQPGGGQAAAAVVACPPPATRCRDRTARR